MTCFVILQCAVNPKGEAGESPVCPTHHAAVTPFIRLRLRWFVQSAELNSPAHPAFVGWFWVVPPHQSCPCTLPSLCRLLLKDTLLCGRVS